MTVLHQSNTSGIAGIAFKLNVRNFLGLLIIIIRNNILCSHMCFLLSDEQGHFRFTRCRHNQGR